MPFSHEQQDLIADAIATGVAQDIPATVETNTEQYLGVFGSPGVRALLYVLVDGEPLPKIAELRDIVTFQTETGKYVQLTPFGQPAYVEWRPNGSDADGLTTLDLHSRDPDGDQYLAVDADTDHPHIIVGWHPVPTPEEANADDA